MTNDVEIGEGTPLVSSYSPENEPPPLKDMKENTLKERAVAGAAAVAFSTSIASMVLESNPAVYVSSAIGTCVAPYAAMQQEKITQVHALQETNERMTAEVQQLQDENLRLKSQVSQLEASVGNLQDMKDTLEMVQATEGQSVGELEKQLEQSKDILNRMEDNLMADVLQNLISVVLGCDNDGDTTLSDEEIDSLILKMEGVHGIDLKEDLLRTKLIEKGRSLNAVLEVIRNVLDDDVPAEENIFNFVETKK